jgi:hypothetical protein
MLRVRSIFGSSRRVFVWFWDIEFCIAIGTFEKEKWRADVTCGCSKCHKNLFLGWSVSVASEKHFLYSLFFYFLQRDERWVLFSNRYLVQQDTFRLYKTCLSILVFLKDIQGKRWLYDQLVQYFINFSRLFWINRVKLKGTDPVTCSMSVCFEEICCWFLGSTIGFFHPQTGWLRTAQLHYPTLH